jgi:hypothetical protein
LIHPGIRSVSKTASNNKRDDINIGVYKSNYSKQKPYVKWLIVVECGSMRIMDCKGALYNLAFGN